MHMLNASDAAVTIESFTSTRKDEPKVECYLSAGDRGTVLIRDLLPGALKVGLRLWCEPGKSLIGDVVFEWDFGGKDTLFVYGRDHVEFNGDRNRLNVKRDWEASGMTWLFSSKLKTPAAAMALTRIKTTCRWVARRHGDCVFACQAPGRGLLLLLLCVSSGTCSTLCSCQAQEVV